MLYVKRDDQNAIVALYLQPLEEAQETLPFDHPDVLQFIASADGFKDADLLRSDLHLIRVIEDLIQILLNKDVIQITDFPTPVIEKLVARQGIRTRVAGVVDMEEDEGEDEDEGLLN